MKVVQEEIFGPVVCAESFDDNDRAVARQANDTHLRARRQHLDQRHQQSAQTREQLRAGTVWVNCHNVFDASLPFGGYKQSGWGREMGGEVLANYTEIKAVTTKL